MELRPYQLAGRDFLREVRRAVLADGMGVGKTPQLIAAAEGRTLVVCPAGLRTNWCKELDRWMHLSDANWHVTSYHSLCDPRIKDRYNDVVGRPKEQWLSGFDTLIFDESHHLKGRKTGYARAGVTLAGMTDRVYMATGTPVRNWAHEVWMLLKALYPGDPRFSSFWNWVERWFTVTDEVTWDGRKQNKHKAIGKLRDITTWEVFVEANGLQGRVLRRTIDDPSVDIDLPPLQVIPIYVDMGPTQAKAYRQMEKSFFAEHQGKRFIETSTGGQWNSLMRLSSGLMFHPEFGQGPSAKLDALGDLLDDVGSDPLLVFAWYHETIDMLCRVLEHNGYTATRVHGDVPNWERNMVAWQAGEHQILVGSYGTLAEGHTLTEADKAVMFEHPAVPSVLDQAMARIHRFGQTRKCTIWSLVGADTTDAYYFDRVLPAKRAQGDAVIRAAVIDQQDLRKYLGR